jgi:hypothetical protein
VATGKILNFKSGMAPSFGPKTTFYPKKIIYNAKKRKTNKEAPIRKYK